ncbi:uncharacterized protein K489DRAFT_380656 [Dissoconium aciculare CBS 342.82]|uniref:Uncharacterized protein n=1 Tax=Dissoconium aciculare CBS 342.82 TaxID=1314786 RepID=A0A6J3M1M3_9PEZI|nr:uncharacterized protein K489DRAFT_380656 [Dissoconium aciculare CBS 342.82]KAF1821916.1 hypothetical protein K489DRAFT_380656 [Dissoconium aciculare CBS 342.82]
MGIWDRVLDFPRADNVTGCELKQIIAFLLPENREVMPTSLPACLPSDRGAAPCFFPYHEKLYTSMSLSSPNHLLSDHHPPILHQIFHLRSIYTFVVSIIVINNKITTLSLNINFLSRKGKRE